MKNNHVTRLQIDLNAVRFNLDYFKSIIKKNTKILVVVKAFGYGSDSIEIAKTIQNNVAYFAVAYTAEGIRLREAGIKTPILVLHPQEPNLNDLIEYNLEPNLYNRYILESFLKVSSDKNLSQYPIHLKFNTGLNRLGFNENDMDFLFSELNKNKTVTITSLFSHLAASEDPNEHEFSLQQIESFNKITANFKSKFGFLPTLHMANTSGIINYPQAHFDMVRLGIGLYGFGNDQNETAKLKNVVSLSSIISQIHHIDKDESVGYNRSFSASNKMKTATIAIGHADGIPRSLGNGKGSVKINNKTAPIIGNVCMDMLMVDVTDINCKAGDKVVIFDSQESLRNLALKANSITYEILTAISQRIQRSFVN